MGPGGREHARAEESGGVSGPSGEDLALAGPARDERRKRKKKAGLSAGEGASWAEVAGLESLGRGVLG